MAKYKYKIDEELYVVGTKRIWLEGSAKHSKKIKGTVLYRLFDEILNKNRYLLKTEAGIQFYNEESITKSKPELIKYLVIKDTDSYEELTEKPEVLTEGTKLLSVWGLKYE
jgi:hypothetical protein